MKKFLTRKELAQLLEVTVDQVRRNERRWGLHKYRRNLNGRSITYRIESLLHLKSLSLL